MEAREHCDIHYSRKSDRPGNGAYMFKFPLVVAITITSTHYA